MWIFAILAIAISALILMVVVTVAGPLIAPLYEIVVNDPAVKSVGFDVGVEVSTRIGLKYVPALLALSLIIWFFVMRLVDDSYQGYNRR